MRDHDTPSRLGPEEGRPWQAYGLHAAVYTNDLDTAIRAARTLRAGTVSVNAYSEGDITTPFGGFKESGFGGRDKGLEAFDQYTEKKTVWISVKG
jgi:gamma-glutamyl-gamma-aminobutyraldehyde dehydrogenase